MKANCDNCRFSATEYGHLSSFTVCRRYPPSLVGRNSGQSNQTSFPRVDWSIWCGEWQAKQTEEA